MNDLLLPAVRRTTSTTTGGFDTDSNYNLVSLHLTGDVNTGRTYNAFSDASPNRFLLTNSGDVRGSSFSPYQNTWSVYFDGTGDYLTTASNAALGFGTGDFTVEGWFYFTGTIGTYQRPWWFGDDNDNLEIFSSVIRFGGASQTAITGPTAVANTWYHIAYTRQSGSGKLFVNGTQVGSTTASSYNSSARTFTLMATSGGANPSTGYVSNLRIVKGVAVYTGAFTPPTNLLQLTQSASTNIAAISGTQTSLLICQSNRFTDLSSNNVSITANGNTSISSFAPFTETTETVVSPSWYFDGSGDYITGPTGNTALNTALDILGGDFTIEFWWYSQTANPDTTIVTNFTSSGGNGWQVGTRLGAININHWVNNSNTEKLSAAVGIAARTWYHIAIVQNSGNYYFYINGTEAGMYSGYTRTVPTNGGAGTGLGIGAYIQNMSYAAYSAEYLSNLRIVKGRSVYTSNFTPSTAPLGKTSGGQNPPQGTETVLLTLQDYTLVDNSSNGFTLTINGNTKSTKLSPFVPLPDAQPSIGWSTLANGSSGLTIPANSAFNLGTNNFSIEFWLNPVQAGLYSGILSFDSADYPLNFSYATANSSNLQANFGTASSWLFTANFDTTTETNRWAHYLATRNGSTFRLFKNGVLTATGTNSGSIGDSNGNININGNGTPGGNGSGTNYISNLRIINGSIPSEYQTTSTTLGTKVFNPPTTTITTTSQGATASDVKLIACHTNTFVDGSSNNFTITKIGTASTTNFNPFPDTLNITTGSGYFDGTGDYLDELTATTAFNLSSGDWTVEAWIYRNVASANHAILNLYNSAGSNNGLTFYVNSSNQLVTDNGATAALSAGTVPSNSWVHLAISRNSGTTTGYINGVSVGTTTQVPSTAQYARIGNLAAGSYNFNGYISNLRIIKGAAVYTGNFTPPTAPLTLTTNTQLLTLQNRGAYNTIGFEDDSEFEFPITRNGNTAQGTFSPFSPSGWSIYLDGSSTFTAPSALQTAFGGWGGRTRTFECWIYRDSATDYSLQTAYAAVADGSRWHITIYTNKLRFGWLIDGGSAEDEAITTATIPLGWVHLSVTVDATTANNATIYLGINGNVQTFTGKNFSTHTGATTRVWNGLFAYTQYMPASFKGYFTGLRWSNNLRYTGNYSVPTASFVSDANTLFLFGQQNRFIDQSNTAIAVSISTGTPSVQAFSPFSGVAYDPIIHGGSGYFDGTGDYLSIAANAQFLPGANVDFSFEAWVYLTATPSASAAQIVGTGEYGTNSDWTLTVNSSLQPTFYINKPFTVTSSKAIALNSWNHIQATRSGTATNNVKLFLNGEQVGQGTETGTLDYNGNNLTLGGDANGDESVLTGYISGVRLINGTGYTSVTVPTAPPTAITNTVLLLNFTNAGIYDATSKNVLETVGNSGAVTTSIRKYGTGSLYFDGTGDVLAVPDSRLFDYGSGDWTIEFWMYRTVNAAQTLITKRTSNAVAGIPNIFANTSNKIVVECSGQTTLTPTGTISNNVWTHVAIVRSGSGSNNVKIYFDGTADATTVSWTALTANTSPIYIGGDSNGNNFTGYLSDIRITRGLARYTANFTPPSKQLPKRGVDIGTSAELSAPPSVDYLVVAGGGGGGGYAGGGGAGGFRTGTIGAIDAASIYTITIGSGGAASTDGYNDGSKGGDSSIIGGSFSPFSSPGIVSTGGGGGGNFNQVAASSGGSGGGAGRGSAGSGNTPSTSPSQGNNGGANGASGYTSGGGGGGAGAVGGTGNNTNAGNGGAGKEWPTGSGTYYAGGGGGGTDNYQGGAATRGTGGIGGGGDGARVTGPLTSTAGTANTGGGGGAGIVGTVAASAGGSGIVVIAYPQNYRSLRATAGLIYTLDTVTRPGYKVYKFTGGTGNIFW